MTFGLLVPNMGKPDLIIDALFGTGLNGTLKGDMLNLINWINQKKTKIISVDIPSGLNSNSFVSTTKSTTFLCIKSSFFSL